MEYFRSIRIEKTLIIFSLIIFLFSFIMNFLLPFILDYIMPYFLGNNKNVNVGFDKYIIAYVSFFSFINSWIFSVGVFLMIMGLYKTYKKLSLRNNVFAFFFNEFIFYGTIFICVWSFLMFLFICWF